MLNKLMIFLIGIVLGATLYKVIDSSISERIITSEHFLYKFHDFINQMSIYIMKFYKNK